MMVAYRKSSRWDCPHKILEEISALTNGDRYFCRVVSSLHLTVWPSPQHQCHCESHLHYILYPPLIGSQHLLTASIRNLYMHILYLMISNGQIYIDVPISQVVVNCHLLALVMEQSSLVPVCMHIASECMHIAMWIDMVVGQNCNIQLRWTNPPGGSWPCAALSTHWPRHCSARVGHHLELLVNWLK